MALSLGLKLKQTPNLTSLIAASGQQLNVLSKVDMTFHIKGLIIVHAFTVVENLFPSLLIGADFLRKNHAVINYANSTVSFYYGLIVLPLQGFSNVDNCACIHKTVCVPGYSKILVPVRLPKSYRVSEAILEPLANNLSKALIGNSLTTVKNGIGMVRMLNFHLEPITLKNNLLVASVTCRRSTL